MPNMSRILGICRASLDVIGSQLYDISIMLDVTNADVLHCLTLHVQTDACVPVTSCYYEIGPKF